jgi:hypothetical protein
MCRYANVQISDENGCADVQILNAQMEKSARLKSAHLKFAHLKSAHLHIF